MFSVVVKGVVVVVGEGGFVREEFVREFGGGI